MEARERQVEESIQLAHTFLMQHDLRPVIHAPSLLADPYSPKSNNYIKIVEITDKF